MLLVNDLYLKARFGNWMTGKLSDFAGLFIFPAFWCCVFPSRRLLIYVLTGVLFTIWKSPFSQPLVDLLQVSRVVDGTDLIALAILPLSYKLFYNHHNMQHGFAVNAVGLLSLFAFCATSPPAHHPNRDDEFQTYTNYKTNMTRQHFLRELDSIGLPYTIGEKMRWQQRRDSVHGDEAEHGSLFVAVEGFRVGEDSISKIYFQFSERERYNVISVSGFIIPPASMFALRNTDRVPAYKKAYARYRQMIRVRVIEPMRLTKE